MIILMTRERRRRKTDLVGIPYDESFFDNDDNDNNDKEGGIGGGEEQRRPRRALPRQTTNVYVLNDDPIFDVTKEPLYKAKPSLDHSVYDGITRSNILHRSNDPHDILNNTILIHNFNRLDPFHRIILKIKDSIL